MKDLFLRLLKSYFEDVLALAKIRAAACYLRVIGAVRCVFLSGIVLLCALLLMLAGFIIMHVAIFMFLPWSPQAKATVLFILGGVYFLVSLLYVLKVCSQKFWMERSCASKLVDEAIGKK